MSIIDAISAIETKRKTRVISYVTGDRAPFLTNVAPDVIPLFEEHLNQIGNQEKISLFLYTRGGDMITPIRLVKLFREYCDKLEVLIPFRAHSAGTLISLGADLIVMGRLAELTPVDPSVNHPFNPAHPNPGQPGQTMELSVEDLNSYFLFAKEKAGVKEDQMVELYKVLTEKVHPLALGNAYRAQRMARMLAERLLEIHMKGKDKQIEKIVKEVTGDICIHNYPITRDQAQDLGLTIEVADADMSETLWTLYKLYEKELKLSSPFLPAELLEGKDTASFALPSAYIQSKSLCHQFVMSGKVNRIKQGPAEIVNLNIDSQQWQVYT